MMTLPAVVERSLPFLARLALFFFVVYPRSLSAQSTCPTAEDITSNLPFEILDSFPVTLHLNVDEDLQECADDVGPRNATLGNGRWYEYNPSNDTIITFQLKEAEGSSSWDIPNLLFFSGSCDNLQCITGGASGGIDSESFLAKADKGPFYFWIYCNSNWNNECDETGQYVFSVVIDEVPTHLTCDTADIMTVPFESRDFFPTSLVTDVESDLQFCYDGVGPQDSSLLGPGRWYEYIPTRDTFISFLMRDDEGGFSTDLPNVLFFSGQCSSLVCLDYAGYFEGASTLQVQVDQGPYFFWLFCESSYNGKCYSENYVFTVIEHPVPGNDRIENAMEISPPLYLEEYTIVGAFSDFSDDPCALSGLVYGVYFQYTPIATELVTLVLDYPSGGMLDYIGEPSIGVFVLTSDGTRQCVARAYKTIDAQTLIGGVTHYILVGSPVPGAFYSFSLRFQSLGFVPTEEPVSSPIPGPGPSEPSPGTQPASEEQADGQETQAPAVQGSEQDPSSGTLNLEDKAWLGLWIATLAVIGNVM